MKNAPNIFSFATSELCQDAMFAWLIQWASPKYAEADDNLHQIGQKFVRLLTGKDESFPINNIDVGRQWENIDVWAEINDDTFLVIEDKTGTSVHDNQLERYKASVEREYKGKRANLCYAYVKTNEEPYSLLAGIEQSGFKVVCRQDILGCLNDYKGTDTLLVSYHDHLQKLEDSVTSYKYLPEKQWGWYAWQGFYKELETRVNLDSWSYVANPSGGFLGAWWHSVEVGNCTMYLQFEQGKLCFKISYEGDEDRAEVRYRNYIKLLEKSKERYPEIHRPERFGSGTYMTIAVVDEENLFGEEPVDFDALASKLKDYEALIDRCCLGKE